MLRGTGAVGKIHKGYREAGHFCDWSLGDGRVEAVPVSVNPVRLAQPGGEVSIWLNTGRRYLVFRHAELDQYDGRIVARVSGTPEIRPTEAAS